MAERYRGVCSHCSAPTSLAVEQQSRSRVAQWICWKCGCPCEQQLPAARVRVMSRVPQDDPDDEPLSAYERYQLGF